MPLPDEVQRVLLGRYRREIDTLVDAGGNVTANTFRRIGTLNESAIPQFASEAGPALREISERAGASASAVTAALTDSPVGVPGVTDPDWRAPFTAGWSALGDGAEFDEAFDRAASVADATGRNTVASTAREAAGASAPAGTMWRRITDSDPCDWCVKVADQLYKSASSANFGHDRCACMVVPADAARNAPRTEAVEELVPTRVAAPDELPSSALRFDNAKAEKLYGETVKQLDELHRITPGVLEPTRVIAGGKSKAKGGHFSWGAKPPKPRRVRGGNRDEYMAQIREWRDTPLTPEIRVNVRGDGSELLTFLHEFGHRMDYLSAPMRAPSTLASGQSVAGSRWYSSGGTKAVRAFQEAAAKTTTIADASKNWAGTGYVQYFRSPEEVWARAYSQWAANKIGGPHRAALDAITNGVNPATGKPLKFTFQWSDAEFEKIGRLVEGVLKERGLL